MNLKLMIASDLHGSAWACRQLLEAFDKEQADRLLLLGDLLYHGPRNPLPLEYDPKAVAEMLNARKGQLLCVRGNCDSEVDQMVLDFPILANYAILTVGRRIAYAVHGHQKLTELQPGDILLQGHTHIAALEERDGIVYANPGSISLPKQDSLRGYLLLTERNLTLKGLNQAVVASMVL